MLFVARVAAAQEAPLGRTAIDAPPLDVEVLLAGQAVLHTADMVSTAYAMSLGDEVREANPLLRSLSRQPVRLVVLSGAIDILQAYTIVKLQRRHPKIALWWARALVATEVWATISNVNVVGELQRRRAAGTR